MQYSFSPYPSLNIAFSFEDVPHSCRKCCIASDVTVVIGTDLTTSISENNSTSIKQNFGLQTRQKYGKLGSAK